MTNLILWPLAGLAAGYIVGRVIRKLKDASACVNAAPSIDLNHLDDLEDLDFATPCNVGPEGVFARQFEQCPNAATWDVEVHRCRNGAEEDTLPVVLCDEHLSLIAEALTEFIDQHQGVLPCGKHANSVFDLVKATRI